MIKDGRWWIDRGKKIDGVGWMVEDGWMVVDIWCWMDGGEWMDGWCLMNKRTAE